MKDSCELNRSDILKYVGLIAFTVCLMLGIFYTCRIHAAQGTTIQDDSTIPHVFSSQGAWESQKMIYYDQYKHHLWCSKNCLEKGATKCAMFPETKDKDKAVAFFQAAITYASATSPVAKLGAMITSLFVSYGLAVIEEYHEVNAIYHEAAYHAEMADFYLELAIKTKD